MYKVDIPSNTEKRKKIKILYKVLYLMEIG